VPVFASVFTASIAESGSVVKTKQTVWPCVFTSSSTKHIHGDSPERFMLTSELVHYLLKPSRSKYTRAMTSLFTHFSRHVGFETLHANLDAFDFAPHAHDDYVIAVNTAGFERVRLDGRNSEVEPFKLTVYNPGQVQSGSGSQGWAFRAAYLQPTVVQHIARDWHVTTRAIHFENPVIQDPDIVMGFLKWHVNLKRSSTLETETHLIGWLGLLLERHGHGRLNVGRDHQAVCKAIAFLEENRHADVSLEALSAVAGLSRSYLVRAFQKATGTSPHLYQLQLRIRAARKALQGPQSLAEIALDLGFHDQPHFGRTFKRMTGLTPQQFRRGL
jgi:AraC-like DNA-binding protein